MYYNSEWLCSQALRFEIVDPNSPFEIFVRELVAMDGVDSSEITLIDSDGCPTDHFIMGPLFKSTNTGKVKLLLFNNFTLIFHFYAVDKSKNLIYSCINKTAILMLYYNAMSSSRHEVTEIMKETASFLRPQAKIFFSFRSCSHTLTPSSSRHRK